MRKRLSPSHLGDPHSQKFPSAYLYLPLQIWRPNLNFVCTWAHEFGNPSCGKEGGGQVGDRMAGALVHLRLKFWHVRASKRGKFSRHQFGYEAPIPRGPGSQLPPSRPPQRNGRSGTGHHRPSSPLAPSLTAEQVQGMQPRSKHTLLPSWGDLVCLGHNEHPRCPWVLTTTASQG